MLLRMGHRSLNAGLGCMCRAPGTPARHFHVSSSTEEKIVATNLKGKSKASQEWLIRHLKDPYVKKAQELNYRARSAFKLIEIDDKFKLLHPGMTVVECGAAPGAWTQVVVQRINSDGKDPEKRVGKVVAIDLLAIAPLDGAIFLPGSDFTDPATRLKIEAAVLNELPEGAPKPPSPPSGRRQFINVVLSDMAPNASGIGSLDHSQIVSLVQSCLQFAHEQAKPGSHFVAKLWDGSELKNVETMMKQLYSKVSRVKPKSSREESAETFLVGQFKLKY